MSPAALKRALDPAYIGSPFAQPFQFFDGDVSTPMDLTGRAVVLFLDRQGPPHAHHEITGVIQTDGRVLFSAADTSAWIKGDYSLEVRLDGVSVVVGRIVVAKGAGASGSDMVGAAQPPTAPGVVIAGSGVVQVVSVAPSAATDPSGIILPQDLSAALGGAETLADALLWLAQNGGTPSPILRDLIGGVVISSVATGALSVAAAGQVLLSGAISSASSAAGSLTVGAASSIALVGTAVSTSSLTGAMTVVTQIALAGSAAGTSAVAGSLTVATDVIGGMAVGQPGAAGTFREGYTLRGGDDFTTLDIVGPAKPTGYLTTRAPIALPGARASAASAHYYCDPLHTGHNDVNRGVPVGYDNMAIVGGTRLKLQARKATTAEKATFSPSSYSGGTPIVLAASVNTARQLMFYAGTTGGEIIVEAMIRFSAKAGNPAGWHPTFWTFSGTPTIESESDEVDVVEGNSQMGYGGINRWAAGAPSNVAAWAGVDKFDGADHLWSAKIAQNEVRRYIDGVNDQTSALDGNSKDRPGYIIFTSVVYLANFNGENYSEAAWLADADGAAMEVDYYRIWSKTACPHLVPSIADQTLNVAYSGTSTYTLPSKASLWGDAAVLEDVSGIAAESNDPTNNAKFIGLPPGVTYNSTTREIAVDWSASTTPAGRLHLNVVAWKDTGSTVEPLNIVINRGPRVALGAQSFTTGVPISLDLYPFMDCGNLVPKTGAVTGLPAGLSFNPSTFLVTGTPTTVSTGVMSVTTTNSAGQSVTTPVGFTVADAVAGPAVTYQQGQTFTTTGASNYTLTAADLGAPAADRVIIVTVSGRLGGAGDPVPTCTIGGVSAPSRKSISSGGSISIVYSRAVPTGSAADVVLTYPTAGSAFGADVSVFRATGIASAVSTLDGQGLVAPSGASGSMFQAITAPSAGIIVAAAWAAPTGGGGTQNRKGGSAAKVVAAGSVTPAAAYNTDNITWTNVTEAREATTSTGSAALNAVMAFAYWPTA